MRATTLLGLLIAATAAGQTPLPPVNDRPFPRTPPGALTWHQDLKPALKEAAAKRRDVFVYVLDSV
ncbi:MAG: hypothetical protein CMJ83_09700 [Planctomycetes bacterium]|nr:hypothetical protein [Planctomycetota bacterium]